MSSVIAPSGRTKVVLARTNATVILEILNAIDAGLKPHVVGGTEELKRLLRDVYELKAGNPATCPEFFGFTNWPDVVAFSETEEGEDIRMFVQLVEKHGEGKLWAAVSGARDNEEDADLVLSTAHKAKGREWDSVRLASDFLSSRLSGIDPNGEAEVRLFYVAMTRAKRLLVVEPELLSTFTTGNWTTRPPEPQHAAAPLHQHTPSHRSPRPNSVPGRDDEAASDQEPCGTSAVRVRSVVHANTSGGPDATVPPPRRSPEPSLPRVERVSPSPPTVNAEAQVAAEPPWPIATPGVSSGVAPNRPRRWWRFWE